MDSRCPSSTEDKNPIASQPLGRPLLEFRNEPKRANSERKPGRVQTAPLDVRWHSDAMVTQEHPLVEPQVSHFRHVPLRTKVKFPQSPQVSPS